ncbi:MAG: hypothetical protein VX278_17695, partial [Myxococcota bacterium]|nr:hypothetical protein [Myxococcota bacterium]
MTDFAVPSVESLSIALNDLPAGQRAWFWMCSHVESDRPAIALAPFGESEPQPFFDAAGEISIPIGSLPATGIATVDADGCLNLASFLIEKGDLERLAFFTKRHISSYPGLSRLRDLRLVRLSAEHTIVEVFEDPLLWSGIPKPIVEGTTRAQLEK